MTTKLNFRLSTGWRSEDKRTGQSDIYETGSAYFATLAAAEAAMAQFIKGCDAHSHDRGSYRAHDCASIDQLDDEGDIVGLSVTYWQSNPAEVAS
jgi:hypothetical protein